MILWQADQRIFVRVLLIVEDNRVSDNGSLGFLNDFNLNISQHVDRDMQITIETAQ